MSLKSKKVVVTYRRKYEGKRGKIYTLFFEDFMSVLDLVTTNAEKSADAIVAMKFL